MLLAIFTMGLMAQEAEGPEDLPLALHLEMNPASVSLEGGVTFSIELENIGQEPILVYKRQCIGNWSAIIVDSEGNESVPSWPRPITFQREPSTNDLKTLNAGEGFGVTPGGVLPTRELVSEPGQYEMKLSCSSPFEWKEHEGVRVWSRTDGPVTATFAFQVVP